MTHQQVSFRRKVIYLSAMAGLLVPLSLWGLPARSQAARRESSGQNFWQLLQGGRLLATLRYQHNLAQGNLGKIDPASETMKFATFGLRGVAATLLWTKANESKMKEDWTTLAEVLDQIALLQPNFVSVWRYQGWNLSFNVSAEQDDYRWRYYYVLKGINYLDNGQKFNDRDTRLFWDEGWFTGYKIGKSDEHKQFRRLFRSKEMADMIDVPDPPTEPEQDADGRDNWLYAKVTFQEALDKTYEGIELRGIGPELFWSEPAKCQIRYIEARNEEGRFGDFSRNQWQEALREWIKFGRREFAFEDGVSVPMEGIERYEQEMRMLRRELLGLGGNQGRAVREQLLAKKIAALPAADRAVLEKPAKDRKPEDDMAASQLRFKTGPSFEQVAQALPEHLQAEGLKLTARMNEVYQTIGRMGRKRALVNYDYWKARCRAEASELGDTARRLLHAARDAYRINRAKAKEPYEAAFKKWRELYDEYPEMRSDIPIGDDLIEEIRRYARVLDLSGEKFDQNKFVLKELLDARQPEPPIGK